MTRALTSIFLFSVLTISCSNLENSSFEDYKSSFYQWNINYSPIVMFITIDDPLLHDKKFIGEDYVNDLKRFLIELNQIDSKKISKKNQKVYTSINNFIKNNIYISETLKFDEWNSLYYVSDFYDHTIYLGKLIDTHSIEKESKINSDNLISEIKFLNDRILFFLENIKYKHKTEIEITTLDIIIKKILNFSSYIFLEEISKYPSTKYSNTLSQLVSSIDKLSRWKNKNYIKLNINPFHLSEISYKKYLHLKSDYKFDFEEIISLAIADLNKYENMLFNYSLPIYLETNDEPVWTDFSDTIDVITSAIDTLNSQSYHCSDKDAIMNFANSTISEILNDQPYIDINVNLEVDFSLDGNHNFDFFNHGDSNNLNIATSNPHNSLFDNYYYTIDKILPGDYFIIDQISRQGFDFNSIYLNKNFFYGYKFLLTDYFLNTDVPRSEDFDICGIKNSIYLNAVKVLYIRDRMIDALTAIVAIEYFLGAPIINDLISRYDQIGLIDQKEKNLLLEEIFDYKMDSIIKFSSINKMKNIIYGMSNDDLERLLKVLHSNPNSSLLEIEKIFKK